MPIYLIKPTDDSGFEPVHIQAVSAGHAMAEAARRGLANASVVLVPPELVQGTALRSTATTKLNCIACDYALEGLPLAGRELTCPECGKHHAVWLTDAEIVPATSDALDAQLRQHYRINIFSAFACLFAVVGVLYPPLVAIAFLTGVWVVCTHPRRFSGWLVILVSIAAAWARM